MTEQPSRAVTLKKALQLLVQKTGLTPEELAGLRLSHLHLAGKNPHLNITSPESKDSKKIDLDLELHRAMVHWLVARPDSTGDFLFPGEETEMMDPAEVRRIAGEAAGRPARPASKPVGRAPDHEAPQASPSRPVPFPSRPEVGAPPPRMGIPGGPPFRAAPPAAPPEADAPPGMPGRGGMPFPPPPPPSMPPEADETMVSIPLPTSASKPSAPPRPSVPVSPVPPPESEEVQPAAAVESQAAEAPAAEPAAVPAEVKPEAAPAPKKRAASPSAGVKKAGTEPGAEPKPDQPTARQAAEQPGRRLPRMILPAVAVVVLLGCVVCIGGGWLAAQSEPGSQLLAGLGLSGGETLPPEEVSEETPAVVAFESPLNSPLPTPTLPPTSTPTSSVPTDTPVPPTDTPAPTSTSTPTLLPTDTPLPTNTPTETSTPRPTAAPVTPTPAEPPTPSMKYGAPALLEPSDDYAFIFGNTLVLRWQPVDLAPDEQYAVRLVYRYNGETVYQGAQVKEPEWTVPLSLYNQIDGPENRYEWFVVVERLNDDGSGTAISPESQHRTFTWK